MPLVPAFFVLFFVTLTVPISLGSLENYRRETLHAQVPFEVLTRTPLQEKNFANGNLPTFKKEDEPFLSLGAR